MKISYIDLYRIAVPYSAQRTQFALISKDFKYHAFSPFSSEMQCILVKVVLDNGTFGWGEAFGHIFNPIVEKTLQDIIIPFFINTELEDYDRNIIVANKAFHSFGLNSTILFGLSGIDIAIWDIRAKLENKPLYKLLGADKGDISLYASLVNYENDPDQIRFHIQRAYQLGFKKIKLHEREIFSLLKVKKHLPDDVELMLDVNCAWSYEDIYHIKNHLKSLGLVWLEEPVWPPEDYVTLNKIRDLGIKVAAGENTSGESGFFHMLHLQSVDIAQPSVTKIGGITGMCHAVHMAAQYQVKVVPHCFYYGPGMLATAHIVAALKNVSLEVPFIQFEQTLHAFLDYSPVMRLPNIPGLGYAIDEQVIQHYLIA